ncbi:hypothetical protein D3C84_1217050 [compost metagenome]
MAANSALLIVAFGLNFPLSSPFIYPFAATYSISDFAQGGSLSLKLTAPSAITDPEAPNIQPTASTLAINVFII